MLFFIFVRFFAVLSAKIPIAVCLRTCRFAGSFSSSAEHRRFRYAKPKNIPVRLDVNFHGFCIRLRRSYLRDSPLSKDFEKRRGQFFCKANILTVGVGASTTRNFFQKNFAKPLTTAAGSAIIPLLPKTAGSGKSASFPAEECLIKLVLLSFFRYPSVLP